MDLDKRVLGAKRVAIMGNNPFQQQVKAMVCFAGGTIVKVNDDAVEFVICETGSKFHASSSEYAAARCRNIPLVNSEWLVTCVRKQELVCTDHFRVLQLAHGARVRLAYVPVQNANSPAGLQMMLTATATGIKGVSHSQGLPQETIWLVEQGEEERKTSMRRFALKSQVTAQYLSAFGCEKGGDLNYDDETSFYEYVTIHELSDTAGGSGCTSAKRMVKLETCHKHWIEGHADGRVRDRCASTRNPPKAGAAKLGMQLTAFVVCVVGRKRRQPAGASICSNSRSLGMQTSARKSQLTRWQRKRPPSRTRSPPDSVRSHRLTSWRI